MALSYILANILYLISEYRTISDNKVYLQKIIGGGYDEVVFGANKPLDSAESRQITFKENEDGAALKLRMIEQYLKKEITFDQLFNDKASWIYTK